MYSVSYLLTDTVRASEELAQVHIASGFKPFDWKALTNPRPTPSMYSVSYLLTDTVRASEELEPLRSWNKNTGTGRH